MVAIPTPLLSSSLFPSREPVLENGRGVWPAVGRVVVEPRRLLLLGVTPGLTPRWLCDKFLAGVGARLGGFLNGDSGRGREGLLALKAGLVGLTPGPTVFENCERAEGGALYAGVGDESMDMAGEFCRFSAR